MPDLGPVVSKAGPLIGLALVGRLSLLPRLYRQVLIPEAVFEEIAGSASSRPGAAEVRQAEWLVRTAVSRPPEQLLAEELGAGETHAIALAIERGASWLLMDDLRARRIAQIAYGLPVKGIPGLLVIAKRQGGLSLVRPVLQDLAAKGYRLSAAVIERTCREAGEP